MRLVGNRLAVVLREPLVHFACAGFLLFAGHVWLNGDASAARGDPVAIGRGEANWLRETFSSQWRRDPTDEEMQRLAETLVREHLLAREARALGLDRDDVIVRRRLAQKLTFLVEETTRIAEPDDDELRHLLAANHDQFRVAPLLTFQHVFYSSARGVRAVEDARADLARMTGADMPQGDPLPLEAEYAKVTEADIARLFGPTFAEQVASLKAGVWSGPLQSGYGVHLVLLSERSEGEARSFDELRPALLDDWRRRKAAQTMDSYLEKLRDKYGVVIDEHAVTSRAARAVAQSAPP